MSSPAEPSPSLTANPRLREWLDFSVDGVVTIRPGKVEYGQGVWTALAQIAAEELDVGLDQVQVAGVSTSGSPDEGVTSGSRSIQDCGGALRQVCAQVRAAFLAEAAGKLGADPAGLAVQRGTVRSAAGPAGLSYWSLDEAALLDRAAQVTAAAKPEAEWSVAGRSAPRIDLPDKVTGRPRFLHDQVLPGMLFGRVIRPPAPAATLDGVGDADLPAGVVVQVRDGSFLGVIAETDRAAAAAAARLAQAARWTVRESLPDEDDLKGFLLSRPPRTSPWCGARTRRRPRRWTAPGPPSTPGRSSRTARWPPAARSPAGTPIRSACGRTARACSRCAGRWPPGWAWILPR